MIVIIFIITTITLNSDVLDVYLENEYFTNLRKYFLFDNLRHCEGDNCQSKILNIQHSLGRKGDSIGTTRHPDTNYVTTENIPMRLMYLDAKVSRVNRNKSTYYKNVGLASSLVAFSLFSSKFNYAKLASKSVGGGVEQVKKEEVRASNDAYEFSNDNFDD